MSLIPCRKSVGQDFGPPEKEELNGTIANVRTGKGKIAVKPDKIRLYVNKEELCKEYEDTLRRSTEDTELQGFV